MYTQTQVSQSSKPVNLTLLTLGTFSRQTNANQWWRQWPRLSSGVTYLLVIDELGCERSPSLSLVARVFCLFLALLFIDNGVDESVSSVRAESELRQDQCLRSH